MTTGINLSATYRHSPVVELTLDVVAQVQDVLKEWFYVSLITKYEEAVNIILTRKQVYKGISVCFFPSSHKGIKYNDEEHKAGCSQIMHLYWVPKTQLPLVNAHFKYLRSNVDVKAAVTHSPPRLLDYYA